MPRRLPQLPPAFHLVALDRELQAFGRAVASAPRGIDDGTVYWTERADRLELQQLLRKKGFDGGTPTGRLGPRTRAAVRDFQASIGLIPDGFATADILARLRR